MNKYLQQALVEHANDGYLHYHAPRFQRLLDLLDKFYERGNKILDVGRSPFTDIARQALDCKIDTLGFPKDCASASGDHYQFDLNNSQTEEAWRKDLPTYDIVVFSEVIEHLYTSPRLVLNFLRSLLSEEGRLLIQTPNAVVAHKRLMMLLGINPYSLISENTHNPAHFREYTRKELLRFCEGSNLIVENISYENYFDYRFHIHGNGSFSNKPLNRVINYFYTIAPRSLAPGLTCVARVKS